MIIMYTIKVISENKIMLYRHENCIFDIHKLCKDFLHDHDYEGRGGEYIVRDKDSAEIAFF